MTECNCNSTSNEEKKCCCGQKTLAKKIIVALFIILLVVFIFYFIQLTENKAKENVYIGQDIASTKTITVTDTAESYAKPDLAIIDFSVVSNAKTVADAMTDNSKKMNAIIDSVKKNGVDEKDLKTTNFSIYPQYEYPYPTGKRVFTGYEITQTLNVKIRNLDKVSQVIDGATIAGANQVGNLQFTIDKQDEIKKQVRGDAIKKAKAKAQELANQLGVRLVRISNFSENSGGVVPVPYYSMDKAVGMGGGAESVPQVQTGENKIEVSVSITYEIN